MAKVPALRKETIPYRSRNHSAQMNQFQEDVFFDLMEAFTELNKQGQEIAHMQQVFTTDNKFLQMRIMQLEGELAKAADVPDSQGVRKAWAFVPDFQPAQNALGIQQVLVDELHRVATMPPSSTPASKLFLKDALTGETFSPAAAGIVTEPTFLPDDLTPDAGIITDANLRDAIDGKDRTTWVRRVTYPLTDDATYAMVKVTVTLPDDIISTRATNMITIHPFPAQSVDVVSVTYCLNDVCQRVPGFPVDGIQASGPIKLCFPDRPIGQVQIVLRQRHWLEEEGQKVFYLGAQEIGVWKEGFASDRADCMVPIHLTGIAPFKIQSITPVIDNQEALSDATPEARSLFTCTLYTVDDNGNLVYTQDQLPVQTTRADLVLKATLHLDQSTGATPELSGVKVSYTSG